MNRYTLNILATQDLNEIAEYFANSNVDAGEEFFWSLISDVNNWLIFPIQVKAMQIYVLDSEAYHSRVILSFIEFWRMGWKSCEC